MLKRRALYSSASRSSGAPLARTVFFLSLLLVACGGSDSAIEDEAFNAGEEMDTSYDASSILARLTNEDVYASPERLETLTIDINILKGSRDFHTARRQAKDLSVDFRNQPMRASMAAALMDRWNAEPPEDITVEDLEQAWAIRRTRKKTAEELAREHEMQLQDRQARQSEVLARRAAEEEKRARAKIDTMEIWIESYRSATTEGRAALSRVRVALSDPSKRGDLGPACRDLFKTTQAMDKRVFQAPDRGIARPLAKAWERYRVASRSCMKGEMAYLTTQLGEGRAAMNEVDKILKGYGKSL